MNIGFLGQMLCVIDMMIYIVPPSFQNSGSNFPYYQQCLNVSIFPLSLIQGLENLYIFCQYTRSKKMLISFVLSDNHLFTFLSICIYFVFSELLFCLFFYWFVCLSFLDVFPHPILWVLCIIRIWNSIFHMGYKYFS